MPLLRVTIDPTKGPLGAGIHPHIAAYLPQYCPKTLFLARNKPILRENGGILRIFAWFWLIFIILNIFALFAFRNAFWNIFCFIWDYLGIFSGFSEMDFGLYFIILANAVGNISWWAGFACGTNKAQVYKITQILALSAHQSNIC